MGFPRAWPVAHATAIYCTAMTVGTVLPSTVGSDVMRGVLTSRYGVAPRDAISSIVIERLIGLLTVLVLACAGIVGVRLAGLQLIGSWPARAERSRHLRR